MSTQLQRSSQEEARLRDEELDYERFMASGFGSLDAADDEQEVRRLSQAIRCTWAAMRDTGVEQTCAIGCRKCKHKCDTIARLQW